MQINREFQPTARQRPLFGIPRQCWHPVPAAKRKAAVEHVLHHIGQLSTDDRTMLTREQLVLIVGEAGLLRITGASLA